MARAFPPLPFQKGAMEAEVPFHHRCRSRQIFGVRRNFARISPNLLEKFFVQFCLESFSHKDHEHLFGCGLQKKAFMCFSANFGCHVLKSNNAGCIPGFSGILLRFSANQNFWGALSPPAPPPPTPQLFTTVS